MINLFNYLGSTVMGRRVDWFFGRGLSIGCGLSWDVPAAWGWLPRNEQIDRIKETIRQEMSKPDIRTGDISSLLDLLSSHTIESWQHQFYTTNWDYLLQREISSKWHESKPRWLGSSHVYHLNGTTEMLANNCNRSDFVLVNDNVNYRTRTCETEKAYKQIAWNRNFVVVGMSFECDVDRFILQSLSNIEDYLPIGDSRWIIVNPDEATLHNIKGRILTALPRGTVDCVHSDFASWLQSGLPELQRWGAIR